MRARQIAFTRQSFVACVALRSSLALCSHHSTPSAAAPLHSPVPQVRVVHPAYRRHVGHVLWYFTEPAVSGDETPLSCLSDHARVRRLTPEMQALVTEVTSKQEMSRATPSVSSPSATSPELVRFINVLVEYLDAETDLEDRLASRHAVKRIQARAWDEQYGQKIRPTPLQRQELVRVACEIVQQRRVPLVVASRLLRCRWPRATSLGMGNEQQRFLRDSIWAWLSEALAPSDSTQPLSPRDARALLDNCAFAFRESASGKAPPSRTSSPAHTPVPPTATQAALVAPLALIASEDVSTVTVPEPLISLLWSVHAARVPAPEAFWRPVVERLLVLNQHLGAEDGVNEIATRAGRDGPSPSQASHRAGHFFSGMTTRHLYRLLSLVKKERWPVAVGTLHELADLALKNVVFETETLFGTSAAGEENGAAANVSRRDVRRRIRDVADLSVEEFLDLLLISGELGIPFSVSASKVADTLLTPLVPYLDVQQLLSLLQIVRQTRCHSMPLIMAAAASVHQRGPEVPYALPLAKALLRTILREPALQAQMELSDFYVYFIRLTLSVATKVRAQELATLAAMLYDLYRPLSPQSTVADYARQAVDGLCAQMARLVVLQLATDDEAAKVLECTIVMGMRQDGERYPHVKQLLDARQQAHAVGTGEAETRSEVEASLVADAATPPAELVSFWGSQAESALPQLPKAAVRVYEELIYLFERTVTIRATPTPVDIDRFTQVLDRTGLYGLLVGLDCLGQAHLDPSATNLPPSAGSPLHLARKPIPDQLPGVLEQRVLRAVNRRIQHARLTADASDNAVLHVLGHVHCDAEKIAFLLRVMARSPSHMVRQQRALWVYLEELARRFGTNEQRLAIRAQKERSLY